MFSFEERNHEGWRTQTRGKTPMRRRARRREPSSRPGCESTVSCWFSQPRGATWFSPPAVTLPGRPSLGVFTLFCQRDERARTRPRVVLSALGRPPPVWPFPPSATSRGTVQAPSLVTPPAANPRARRGCVGRRRLSPNPVRRGSRRGCDHVLRGRRLGPDHVRHERRLSHNLVRRGRRLGRTRSRH